MNNLLKWSLENTSTTSPTSPPPAPRTTSLNAEALKVLMGGPSDADLMRESMAAIQSADISLEDKLVAFDNFEQLIESIDNANNMQTLGLWTPLVALLSSEEEELRRMAAWCVGTAVQNNVKAQERVIFFSFFFRGPSIHCPSEQLTSNRAAPRRQWYPAPRKTRSARPQRARPAKSHLCYLERSTKLPTRTRRRSSYLTSEATAEAEAGGGGRGGGRSGGGSGGGSGAAGTGRPQIGGGETGKGRGCRGYGGCGFCDRVFEERGGAGKEGQGQERCGGQVR